MDGKGIRGEYTGGKGGEKMRRLLTVHSHGSRNRKHQALLDIAWKQWDKIMLEDPTTEMAFKDLVKATCDRLNREYPRSKTIGVYNYQKGSYISIADMPYTSENCDILSVSITPAEKEYGYLDIVKKVKEAEHGE